VVTKRRLNRDSVYRCIGLAGDLLKRFLGFFYGGGVFVVVWG